MAFDLVRLPPEVLANVFEAGRIPYALIRLWLCGDSLMNAKLASGVTRVHLKAPSSWSFSTPRFVLSLRALRRLIIKSNKWNLFTYDEWCSFIESLPSSLEELTIPLPKSNEDAESTPQYIDLERFVQLRALNLNLSVNLILSKFPPNLVELTVPLNMSYEHDAFVYRMAHLPRSLRRLKGYVMCLFHDDEAKLDFQNDWKLAPPLEYIEMISFPLRRPATADFLPKTVQYYAIDENNPMKWGIEQILALPPALTFLVIEPDITPLETSNTDWMALLPSNIRSLSLNSDERSPTIKVASLPRSLTKLSTNRAPTFEFPSDVAAPSATSAEFIQSAQRAWPSQLTELSLVRCHATDLRLFPNNITSLTCILDFLTAPGPEGYEINATDFPSHLTSLELSETPLSIKGKLPSSISRLRFTDTVLYHMNSFPPYLTDLALPEIYRTIVNPWTFYEGITSLTLDEWNWFDVRELPKSLTYLQINTITHLATVNLRNGDFFEDFPSGITALGINYSQFGRSFNFPSQRLASALPHLQGLFIPSLCTFPSEFLRQMPQGLQRLQIRLAEVAEKDYPFIPQKLTYLVLQPQVIWTPLLAEYWPIKCFYYVPYNETEFRDILRRRVREM